jgi:hypothetical protein
MHGMHDNWMDVIGDVLSIGLTRYRWLLYKEMLREVLLSTCPGKETPVGGPMNGNR